MYQHLEENMGGFTWNVVLGGYFFKQNEKYINHKGKNAYT